MHVYSGDLDRIDQIKEGNDVVADYSYVGYRIEAREMLNGVDLTIGYDAARRITDMDYVKSQTTIAGFDYAYDDRGFATSVRRAHNRNLYDAYEYDKMGEITRVYYEADAGSSPSSYTYKVDYTFDGVYNIDVKADTQFGQQPVTTNYTNNSVNQYTAIGGTSPSYDDNGNVTDNGEDEFSYDYENRIVQIEYDEKDFYSFKYDVFGRRIEADWDTDGVTRYFYDGWRCIEETDDSGTPVVEAKYIYGGTYIDEVLRMERKISGQWYDFYYHADKNWTVEKVTSSNGTVAESYALDVFGDPVQGSSSIGNTFLFQGRRYDWQTDTYYYRHRTYGPNSFLRFYQRDPLFVISEPKKLLGCLEIENIYEFVADNPVNSLDPFGLDEIFDHTPVDPGTTGQEGGYEGEDEEAYEALLEEAEEEIAKLKDENEKLKKKNEELTDVIITDTTGDIIENLLSGPPG